MTSPSAQPLSPVIPPERIGRLTGYGLRSASDAYIFRPTNIDEIRGVFALARQTHRQVTLRGAGRSYGDANIGAETLVVDITRMNRILSWNATSGEIDCEAGATLENIWRQTIEDGYWPPVVSGTMFPTLAGALAMNIHGKNNYCVGTLGEHVLDLDVLLSDGELLTLDPTDERFFAVISGAGLLGVITRVKLKLKKIHSGDLRVLAASCANWDAQFKIFEDFEADADYMVSWIDCFATGASAGRGQFHAAWYLGEDEPSPKTLRPEHQDLPDTILGWFPKSVVWRFLKLLNHRLGMKFVNFAKQRAGSLLGGRKVHHQSLVGFSFLLDYVPNWRRAYLPGGFIQYQSFVPKEHAQRVFAEQIRIQQGNGLESFLGVLKRHRPDPFLLSHAVDGYSLALDFKVTRRNWTQLQEMCHQMNDLVLKAGGRFYLAKDSTLRPEDVQAYLGDNFDRFVALKKQLDPDGLLTSDLAKRLKLA